MHVSGASDLRRAVDRASAYAWQERPGGRDARCSSRLAGAARRARRALLLVPRRSGASWDRPAFGAGADRRGRWCSESPAPVSKAGLQAV